MSITASNIIHTTFGDKSVVIADLAIDSTYAEGGVTLEHLPLLGLHTVDALIFCGGAEGLNLHFDYATSKIKALNPNTPLRRFDELHLAEEGTDQVITLDYPAAFIQNVAYGGQNYAMRSTGVTPAANQCSLVSQMADGVRTQLTLYAAELLTNGTFTGNATGWTLGGTGVWEYAGNQVDKIGDGVDTLGEDAGAPTAATVYDLKFTISKWQRGTVLPNLGSTDGTAVSGNGTYRQRITATDTDPLIFTPSSTARFSIDSVSVKAVPSAMVTYITQAWQNVWDNLVQDEAKTLATGANTLTSGNKILAVMYMDQITATAGVLLPVDEDDTAASGELEVAFNVATDQLTAHSDQNAKAIKITYLKVPTSGFLKDRAFNNEAATKAGADPYTNTFDYPILIWGYSGYLPVNGGATQALIDYGATPAAGEAIIDWFTPGARGGGAPAAGTVIGLKSNLTGTGAGVWGFEDDIADKKPLELVNGKTLSVTSVKVLLLGY